ncbi:CpaD family pilus assembly protein [Lichenifustis flavocetrariae]|uniref:CpaD family pilus assembly protein n=1 Tax=Lichenifustis flavocetrariae TaxID=2949735 RepID=A0AA41YZD7_9HYPH|nr:CpaD family pilus assembly protein [Lichenifustis flavocetrariae]MCW6506492.1 CpaD family pilus assembly protein [Lichenifustis flavocetrariae]
MTAPIEIAPMSAPASLRGSAVARPLALLLVLAGTLASAGCSSPVDRAVATMPVSEDYRLRHPVVLANAPQRLDIFFVGPTGQLDVPQARQLEAFARSYLAEGQSGLQIAIPEGAVDHAAAERTLTAVRRALLQIGVKGRVSLSAYPVRDPAIASPLHLSYAALQARPTTRCGEWPDDLGSGATLATWNNSSYYNFGCANQQTLAAQIADPRDLVKPRALDPTDVQLRTRAIQSLRGTSTVTGVDPSTIWTNNPIPIGPAGQF